MAINNRTDAISQVNSLIVPQVTNVTHRQLLNDNILNSVNFRKDIIASTSAAGGVATCDFSNTELITLSLSDSVAINFTGLQNGDLRWLYVTKPTTKSVSFNSAFDVTPFIKNVTALKTSVLYEIYNKNGVVFVRAVTDTLPEAVLADIVSGDVNKITTAKAVQDYALQKNAILSINDITANEGTVSSVTGKFNIVDNRILVFNCKFTYDTASTVALPIFYLNNIALWNSNNQYCNFYFGGNPLDMAEAIGDIPLTIRATVSIPAGSTTVGIWGTLTN